MIELRLIRHTLALARFRNYARAAQSLHLTQPTMTRSIAALERAVGVRLFDRGPNGVEPTAFGNILLERGARVLAGEADLRREIQLLAGLDVGRLAVSAAPFPFEISVGAAVAPLIAAHPRLKVRALLADPREVVRDVLARSADVVWSMCSSSEVRRTWSLSPCRGTTSSWPVAKVTHWWAAPVSVLPKYWPSRWLPRSS